MSDDDEFPVNAFLDLFADVADSDDDGVEDEVVDSEDREFIDDSDVEEAQRSTAPKAGPVGVTSNIDDTEEIARGICKRARKRARTGSGPHDDAGSTNLSAAQQAFKERWSHLPERAKVDFFEEVNYSMYAVRSRNARRDMAFARERLPKTSLVFRIPWLRDRFYVWVSGPDIVDALLKQATGKHWKPLRVLQSEVDNVFAMRKGPDRACFPGSWVKVLTGEFAGDLGFVKDVSVSGKKFMVAVLPRVVRGPDEDAQNGPQVQRPVTLEWLKTTFPSEDVSEVDDKTYEFRGGRYEEGLRVLTLTQRRFEPVFPYLHEVFSFSLGNYGILQYVESYLRTGDVVVVQSGQFRNMVAIIKERMGLTVVLHSLRRIELPVLDEPERETDGEMDIGLTRTNVIELILREAEDELEQSEQEVEVKHVRRIIDVGDEVLVRVGGHAGRTGFVLSHERDNLTLQFSPDEPVVEVSRYWVETVDAGGFVTPQKDVDDEVRLRDVVLVRSGPFKGRWGTVSALSSGMCVVLIKEPKTGRELQIRVPQHLLHKFTHNMLETGVQPLFTSQEGLVYPKLARSPYVGKFVAVVNRDKKDFQARLTKGRYGYVKSVDVERSRARVSFENKEVTIALINLVLLDEQKGVQSLDPSVPLDALLKLQIERQYAAYREEVSRHLERTSRTFVCREPTPLPETPEMSNIPVTNVSQLGAWVFNAAVRSMYDLYKVYVRVKSKARAGFITGDIGEDHKECRDAHDKCRIIVHLDWSRTISATVVEVSDIESAKPTKKNQLCVQVNPLPTGVPLLLLAKGVPRSSERPITVCSVLDENKMWDVEAVCLTRVEKMGSCGTAGLSHKRDA